MLPAGSGWDYKTCSKRGLDSRGRKISYGYGPLGVGRGQPCGLPALVCRSARRAVALQSFMHGRPRPPPWARLFAMHNACSHRAPLLAFGGDINVKSHIKEEKIVILGLKTSGFTKMGFLTFALLK